MLDRANTKDGMPPVRGASHLALCEIEQWLRRFATTKGRGGRGDWHDSRQHLRRPKDGLLAERPLRVMSESRYPTSS